MQGVGQIWASLCQKLSEEDAGYLLTPESLELPPPRPVFWAFCWILEPHDVLKAIVAIA